MVQKSQQFLLKQCLLFPIPVVAMNPGQQPATKREHSAIILLSFMTDVVVVVVVIAQQLFSYHRGSLRLQPGCPTGLAL